MNKTSVNPEIIHEDAHLIVCRKPAGLPVQTARFGQQDMESLLKNYRAKKGEPPEIHVVHRLDQPVEGVMVFAKTRKAAASLSKQIQQKTVDKYYLAVAEGIPTPPEGTLTDYLLRDGKTNTSKAVKKDSKGAKKAVLQYRTVKSREIEPQEISGNVGAALVSDKNGGVVVEKRTVFAISLLEIQLETGRHHQIRVQLAHAGHPLVGDKKYNPHCPDSYLPIGLCSARLSFAHPITGKRMDFAIEPTGEAFREFF